MNRELKKRADFLKPYIKSIFEYMRDNSCGPKKMPKIILDNSDQGEDIFIYTGYFDPNNKSIRLFVKNRHNKDILRTLCHEFVHRKQDEDGIIEKSGYRGDKITEDENLIKLESEAYLKGNMTFRSWTEIQQKKNKKKLNESIDDISFDPSDVFVNSNGSFIKICYIYRNDITVAKLSSDGEYLGTKNFKNEDLISFLENNGYKKYFGELPRIKM